MYKLLSGHLHPQVSDMHIEIAEGVLNQEQVRALEQVAKAFYVRYRVSFKDGSLGQDDKP